MAIQPLVRATGLNPHNTYTTWSYLNGDTFDAAEMTQTYGDVIVEVEGSFSGATATFEGSVNGSLWTPLQSGDGTPLALTAEGAFAVGTVFPLMRPRVTGGDGVTALTFTMFGRILDA